MDKVKYTEYLKSSNLILTTKLHLLQMVLYSKDSQLLTVETVLSSREEKHSDIMVLGELGLWNKQADNH